MSSVVFDPIANIGNKLQTFTIQELISWSTLWKLFKKYWDHNDMKAAIAKKHKKIAICKINC